MRSSVALALALTLAAPAAAVADVSGPQIVSFLNAQRAANGIPAGIVEDPALSDGCAKHNAYGARNDSLEHSEDPGLPGYTPEGNEAAGNAVLYNGGGPWSATNNPFETAPIHLHQLLAPRLDRMGAAENSGYGCATTLASRERPAPAADVTYTYPGDGARDWPTAQTAAEFPYTPGQQAGLPADATTGPYLYVMFDGPDLNGGYDNASGATGTLAGPAGPVPVVVADNTTKGLEGYLPTGAEIIPRTPLAPATTYTASVAATVLDRTFTHAWRFTTAPGPAPYTAKLQRRGGKIAYKVTARLDCAVRLKVQGAPAIDQRLAAGKRLTGRVATGRRPARAKLTVLAAGTRSVVRKRL